MEELYQSRPGNETVIPTIDVAELVTAVSDAYEDSQDDSQSHVWVILALLIIIFILGLLANLSILYLVAKNKQLRTRANVFVVNLAVGDIYSLVANFPFLIRMFKIVAKNDIVHWVVGEFGCKFLHFSRVSSACVTVFALLALAIERYLVIVRPLRSRDRSSCERLVRKCCLSSTWQTVLLIWSGASLFGAPFFYFAHNMAPSNFVANDTICMCMPRGGADFTQEYTATRLIVAYTIPFIVMSVATALTVRSLMRSVKDPVTLTTDRIQQGRRGTQRVHSRKKLAIVITIFSFMFFSAWITFYVVEIWAEFFFDSIFHTEFGFYLYLHVFDYFPVYIMSCLNPVALYVLSSRFRKQLLQDCFCCCRISFDMPRLFLIRILSPGQHDANGRSAGNAWWDINYEQLIMQSVTFKLFS